jgi:hypothetical protein
MDNYGPTGMSIRMHINAYAKTLCKGFCSLQLVNHMTVVDETRFRSWPFSNLASSGPTCSGASFIAELIC